MTVEWWTTFTRHALFAGSLWVTLWAAYNAAWFAVKQYPRRVSLWVIAGVAATHVVFWGFVSFIPESAVSWWGDFARWLSRGTDVVALVGLFTLVEFIRIAERRL